jgi:hypothetical protein
MEASTQWLASGEGLDMAKWRPRISPAVESELQALGPHTVVQSGLLVWHAAPGFEWPWGPTSLQFLVDYRAARDADFLRLIDAWRQVRERQEEVAAMMRRAVVQAWAWARENLPAEETALSGEDSGTDDTQRAYRQLGGCTFSLATSGARQVSMAAHVKVEWDTEHGVEVDLIEPERRDLWSFP